MAQIIQQAPLANMQNDKMTHRRSSEEGSGERTLISPQTLRRPSGRLIYWGVFALLLIFTLVAIGPIYWMFSGGFKSSLEILQTPPTIWPLHPQWVNFVQAWKVLEL